MLIKLMGLLEQQKTLTQLKILLGFQIVFSKNLILQFSFHLKAISHLQIYLQ